MKFIMEKNGFINSESQLISLKKGFFLFFDEHEIKNEIPAVLYEMIVTPLESKGFSMESKIVEDIESPQTIRNSVTMVFIEDQPGKFAIVFDGISPKIREKHDEDISDLQVVEGDLNDLL